MNEIIENTGLLTGLKRIFSCLAIILLMSCASKSSLNQHRNVSVDLRCNNAAKYAKQVVGDGHCVSLIKKCSGAPDTIEWRPGERVLNSKIPAGTIIATFKNGRYPSKHGYHAAIYIRHDKDGIWVWDQWRGKPVHQRLIRIRDDGAHPSNTAQSYRVVRLN